MRLEDVNAVIDHYNAALEAVLSDEVKLREVETILDERKAILVVDGGLPEEAAESIVCRPDNLRRAVLSVAGA